MWRRPWCIFNVTSNICKYAHGRNDTFLCAETGDCSCNRLPLAPAKRSKERRDRTTNDSHKAVCGIFNNAKGTISKSKSRKQPHYYAGKEQDRTSFDDEAFQPFPYMKENCFNLRNMILWKLHYERSRFTGERFCLLKNDCCYKHSYDSDEVHQRSDKGALCISCSFTSDYTTHKSDNRKFGTTRNKCCCHNSKTSVIVLFDGLGSHDSRDTAS